MAIEMEWYDKLRGLTKGMPSIDAVPHIDMPEGPPPSASENVVDMDDRRLSEAYHLVSKWKAFCDYATGVYSAAEVAYAQQLAEVRKDVYMEHYSSKKPSNVREGEMVVANDKRVKKMDDMHTAMKQGRIMYDKLASTYQQLAMTYGNERKDRREREMRSSFDD